jgi:outer membrane protein assembly factor BamB
VEANGELVAVAADGTLRWSVPLDGRVDVSPAVAADGTVYVSFVQGEVRAFR